MSTLNSLQSLIVLVFTFLIGACSDDASDMKNTEIINETVRINEIQILASHNSYRKKTFQPIFDFIIPLKSILPASFNPDGLDYNHEPFEQQLNEYNIRGFEIDVHPDPDGGHYFNRQGNSFVNEPVASGIPQLLEPGLKVLHIPDIDYETNYFTFQEALQALKNWSDNHPNHIPLFVNIETKGTEAVSLQNFAEPIPYTTSMIEEIDNEIKKVFGNSLEKIITPDKVRGTFATLEEAVLAKQWPTLKEARGKIIFLMFGQLTPFYKTTPSLRGRAMFVDSQPGNEEAAFIKVEKPIENLALIRKLVQDGYLVRTRADEETMQARSGDFSMMNAAFNSGAQMISTDYYKPDERAGQPGWTNYQVKLPSGKQARINPISAPEKSSLGDIEE